MEEIKEKKKAAKRAVPTKQAARTSSKVAEAFGRYKKYQGSRYAGIKNGVTQKWYYDRGVWRDVKTRPDESAISYEVIKRHAGKDSAGSDVAVGTEYHWFVIAEQKVEKMDAGSYHTRMEGIKFKIAHKGAGKDAWNVKTEKGRKKRLIRLLKKYVAQLEEELKSE